MAVARWELEALMQPGDLEPSLLAQLAADRPPWMARAACRGQGTATFFPGKGQSAQPARSVCASCPVATECGEYVLADDGLAGVWAGSTERERARLRREPAPAKSDMVPD